MAPNSIKEKVKQKVLPTHLSKEKHQAHAYSRLIDSSTVTIALRSGAKLMKGEALG